MSSDFEHTPRLPMIRLLGVGFDYFQSELAERVAEAGYADLRPGHGCVFGNIDPENGSRLTDLAERAMMTKQTVGEVTNDLVALGYVERVPDPEDGRAKIIRLTAKGREAHATATRLIDGLEADWADRFGEDRVAALRDLLEAVHAERFGAVPA
jgi:DNA-binding MarR family transcriptional regulator